MWLGADACVPDGPSVSVSDDLPCRPFNQSASNSSSNLQKSRYSSHLSDSTLSWFSCPHRQGEGGPPTHIVLSSGGPTKGRCRTRRTPDWPARITAISTSNEVVACPRAKLQLGLAAPQRWIP